VSTYVYDQGWQQERERLAGIESLWDPGTIRVLEELGLSPESTCLEVGGGGGAVVEWLCSRAGRVVATDLDTRFLDAIEATNLEVRRHDIVADEPPPERFDLVHARLVLEHLPARDSVLERLASLLAPGGVLVVEDYDWASAGSDPPSADYDRVRTEVLGYMTEVAGFDDSYGRRLVRELRRVGLRAVDAEGRLRLIDVDSPGADFFRLSLLALREPLIEAGRLTAADIDGAVAMFDEPGLVLVSPTMVAAWGRAARA
jgi:SAM-dependent methyltransferase